MEYRNLTTGQPIYFAWESHEKTVSPQAKLAHIITLYFEKYGVKPVRALLSIEDAYEILSTDQTFGLDVVGRPNIEPGLFFLQLPEEEV